MRSTSNSIVIALWGKGGSGKSTSAISLAGLAAAEGRRTVILDCDPQRSTSEWHAITKASPVAVHSTEVSAVAGLLEKARSRYHVVIIDNPPAPYSGSLAIARQATCSLIVARPFCFDLTLSLEWISFLDRAGTRALVALTAAPARRMDEDAPAVRVARDRLKKAGAIIWRHQITHRLVYPDLIQRGLTVTDLPPMSVARSDYARLWSALIKRSE